MPSPKKYERSQQLREQAHAIIAAGCHTYSKGDDQFPMHAPGFIVRGKGSRCWDVDGNEFIDWGMGLRSVILGHAYPRVLEAVRAQLEFGSNFTRPAPIELELAELLVDLIPSAEMVKFAKNGSDVTT
ncbi:MAG: aminotransferase class III-fold pyridoxal phosphate-dependent enzyme, partial [Nitrospirae bacterium]